MEDVNSVEKERVWIFLLFPCLFFFVQGIAEGIK